MKLECECFALDAKGRGLVRIQDKVLSISNLLPGEKAILEINQKKNFIDAKVIEIISASKHRVEPSCSHFSQCGGCQLLHLDYKAQLDFKRRQLVKLFKKEAYFLLDLGYENLWYILYPHLRHELLNERKRDRIYKDVLGFYRR